jgi:hypothetical protein
MIELTEEQKKYVLDNWSAVPLLELTRIAFNNPNAKGTSAEGIAIRKFLGSKKPKTSAWEKVEVQLTEANKEFIKNNPLMRPIEISRVIFSNPKIEPLSRPVLTVREYQDSLKQENVDNQDLPAEEYTPPTHLVHVVNKINTFVHKDLKLEAMPMNQKKMAESLRNFLRAPRFLQMINAYVSNKNRRVFEEEFVRAVWDKPDLTPDELNLYINLCSNYVQMITILRHLDLLNERYEKDIFNTDKNVSQSLAEMIKAKTDELNKCDKRQSELVNDLQGKRSVRMKERKGASTNIANLIEWFRDYENRRTALAWAEKEAKETEEELNKLISLPDMKAQILGLSESELKYG